jgi:hypothetical protein
MASDFALWFKLIVAYVLLGFHVLAYVAAIAKKYANDGSNLYTTPIIYLMELVGLEVMDAESDGSTIARHTESLDVETPLWFIFVATMLVAQTMFAIWMLVSVCAETGKKPACIKVHGVDSWSLHHWMAVYNMHLYGGLTLVLLYYDRLLFAAFLAFCQAIVSVWVMVSTQDDSALNSEGGNPDPTKVTKKKPSWFTQCFRDGSAGVIGALSVMYAISLAVLVAYLLFEMGMQPFMADLVCIMVFVVGFQLFLPLVYIRAGFSYGLVIMAFLVIMIWYMNAIFVDDIETHDERRLVVTTCVCSLVWYATLWVVMFVPLNVESCSKALSMWKDMNLKDDVGQSTGMDYYGETRGLMHSQKLHF